MDFLEFSSALSVTFSSPEYASAFMLGVMFTAVVVLFCCVVPNVVDVIIEIVRYKLCQSKD